MASFLAYTDVTHPSKAVVYHGYFDILAILLAIWPMFIILTIVFILSTRKKAGLWSTEQPFMQEGWGLGYYVPPGTFAPVQQQQEQHPYPQPVVYEGQYVPRPHEQQYQGYYPSPHEYSMGLVHQTDGTSLQAAPPVYMAKAE